MSNNIKITENNLNSINISLNKNEFKRIINQEITNLNENNKNQIIEECIRIAKERIPNIYKNKELIKKTSLDKILKAHIRTLVSQKSREIKLKKERERINAELAKIREEEKKNYKNIQRRVNQSYQLRL